MSEGYARFCENSRGKVPLEGLQNNKMLRARPTTEGRLERVTGQETWSFSIVPGRGVRADLVRQRDQIVENWELNVPPEPDWETLEGNYLVHDDMEPEPQPEEPVFDMEFSNLVLT